MRRICLYGGPGCGKSTIAAKIYAEFKIQGKNIELVREKDVKDWAYLNRPIRSWDQLFILSQQLLAEELPLSSGVDTIITDVPLYMCCMYAKRNGLNYIDELVSISSKFEEQYPSLNVFIERPKGYQQLGRFESFEDAIKVDNLILGFFKENNIKHVSISCEKCNDILSHLGYNEALETSMTTGVRNGKTEKM